VPVVPIATFLAGALLTLLLPVLLLVALVVWYWWFSARVPETSGADVAAAPAAGESAPAMAHPGPPMDYPEPSAVRAARQSGEG
jgi:hypothetical protein